MELYTTVAIIVLLLVAGTALLTWYTTWRHYRGVRVITCPETGSQEAVEIDAARAANAAVVQGWEDVGLRDCSRWPERSQCDQACRPQISASADGCLARSLLERWYEGKACALCKSALTPIHWHDHKPAFVDENGMTIEWRDLPPETIPYVLQTHRPVCWNCHIAESFRRLYPDLVVDRPERKRASG